MLRGTLQYKVYICDLCGHIMVSPNILYKCTKCGLDANKSLTDAERKQMYQQQANFDQMRR